MKTTLYTLSLLSTLITYNEAIASSDAFYEHAEELILYNPNIANAVELKKCALIKEGKNSCPFLASPLIGQNLDQISVSDILDKTMASKKEYLETFKYALNKMPAESLVMFGSVNAVVISHRISPSFYSFVSGAIYLSGDYFKKKASEETAKDHREEFGTTLNFSEHIDYFKGNKRLSAKLPEIRTNEDLYPFIAKVLFHELSHANEFFPRSLYTSPDFDENKTSSEIANSRIDLGHIYSYKLRLSSNLLERICSIMNMGETPTDTDLNMNPKYVVDDFLEADSSDLYAHCNSREDFAMLVEHNLMYYFLDYTPVTVFIKYPKANFTVPKNYKNPILGGVKNKIAAENVKWRSQGVLESIFGAEFKDKVMNKLKDKSQVIIPKNASWENLNKL